MNEGHDYYKNIQMYVLRCATTGFKHTYAQKSWRYADT